MAVPQTYQCFPKRKRLGKGMKGSCSSFVFLILAFNCHVDKGKKRPVHLSFKPNPHRFSCAVCMVGASKALDVQGPGQGASTTQGFMKDLLQRLWVIQKGFWPRFTQVWGLEALCIFTCCKVCDDDFSCCTATLGGLMVF